MADNRTRGQTALEYMDSILPLLEAAKRAFPGEAMLTADGPLSYNEIKARNALVELIDSALDVRRLCWEAWNEKS